MTRGVTIFETQNGIERRPLGTESTAGIHLPRVSAQRVPVHEEFSAFVAQAGPARMRWSAGGNEPSGNRANRSPARSRSTAS